MKKLILLLVFLSWNQFSKAQEIGFRVGDVAGGSAAIDGVFSLGDFNRIHADVSFGDNAVGLEALWDFTYKPLDGEALKWYAGVGPSVLLGSSTRFLGASGEIGLEYRFENLPIALGLDWRPTFWIIENTELNAGGFGFNARYVF